MPVPMAAQERHMAGPPTRKRLGSSEQFLHRLAFVDSDEGTDLGRWRMLVQEARVPLSSILCDGYCSDREPQTARDLTCGNPPLDR